MNPVAIAIRAKGGLGSVRRARQIAREYGNSGARMAACLAQFARLLADFACSATFPITSVVLARNPALIQHYQDQGIEFAVHGYRHTDYSRMTFNTQVEQLTRAREVFSRFRIEANGFRSPYLRHTLETRSAIGSCGFLYDASQALAWNCLPAKTPDYVRALSFYGALPVEGCPSLPEVENGMVRIPYCLPDDESVVDRLRLTPDQTASVWLNILERTIETGELFCLGIHPERIGACAESLRRVLSVAKQRGTVWIARMEEIAKWWKARASANVQISNPEPGKFRIRVAGPDGITVLVRGVECSVSEPVPHPSADGHLGPYRKSASLDFIFASPVLPFVGFDRRTAPEVVGFLKEQGYLLETGLAPDSYSLYVEVVEPTRSWKRDLLSRLESSDQPLIRLARWPHAYQSAIAVTGDIDALTCWDYGLRLLGR
ncbi:MAG: polysaccharide deacetylase family protein [Acidobacteriota bacterium]